MIFPESTETPQTSNVVNRLSRGQAANAASRRFKSQVNATCLIWKTMMVAEMSFNLWLRYNPHEVEGSPCV